MMTGISQSWYDDMLLNSSIVILFSHLPSIEITSMLLVVAASAKMREQGFFFLIYLELENV